MSKNPLFLSPKLLRTAQLVALVLLSACGHATTPVSTMPSIVRPGQWKSPVRQPAMNHYSILARSPKDSSEREWYRMDQGEERTVDAGRPVLVTVQGASAFQWADTVVMGRDDMVPIREALHLNGRVINLSYSGNTVIRADQFPDSALRTTTQHFDRPVFAFNQLDLLIRAMPLAAGARVILPLYSEITAELELDTLEVTAPPASGHSEWTVRFADPAIVTIATVDPATRQFTSYATSFRARAGGMRRVPAP